MISAYIHIPFCKKICNYCDFCKFFYNEKWVSDYLNSLEKEIKNTYKGEDLYTIYIGGGTPSALSIKDLTKLFKILKLLNQKNIKEFTIECNIEDITKEKLELFKNNNINRISIGIQSFNKRILKSINRNYEININEKIKLAKEYFNNINVDLIYGYFDQTLDELNSDLNSFLELNINHISCYSLMIEPHTKFYDKKPIDEELDYEMYKLINKKLKDNNFVHYEISNYAKKGFESKHNLVYWSNNHYYGFGLSASSYLNNIRSTNTKNIKKYLNGINSKEIEIITKKDEMKYEIILGLRKIKGINKKDFYNKYNINVYDAFDIKKLIDNKYIIDNGENIYINEDYIYISNEILINFL